ncbi:MAG TPA: CHAT domain-containing protein [Anaerolineales bacterium]|nr:CHAT domain-containing protein [Anaerolineales bacterium]
MIASNTGQVELEIGLHRREASPESPQGEIEYTLEFRGRRSDSAADVRAGNGTARFDVDRLSRLYSDPSASGAALAAALFADPRLAEAFNAARTSAETLNVPLRLRVLVGSSAPELHRLPWETLHDPRDNSLLTTNANLPFSRYLSSPDWRPVVLRSRGQLRALVVAANPSDLASYDLAPVDASGELSRAKTALGSIQVSALPDESQGKRASLDNILAHLQQQPCDLLYLVCHGAWMKDDTWLWLEDAAGKTQRVSGSSLVERLQSLTARPVLVVLASCQSADSRAEGSLSALGPRLVDAGIPAVLAMQANISPGTVEKMMPVFFTELQRHGQIDQALSTARGSVNERQDYWVPALFTRLEDGYIWNLPGFRGEHGERVEFKKWPSLLRDIQNGRCTPILGPGLYEPLLGSSRQIAQHWAEEHGYPMAPYERDSLPQVAQYLTVSQSPGFPYSNLEDMIRAEIRTRFGETLPPEYQRDTIPLDDLITQVGAMQRSQHPDDPYRVLAELPLPIYLTATPDNLLYAALQEANSSKEGTIKDPQTVLCRWNEYTETARSIYKSEPGYYPDPDRPLVYYFFGRLGEIDSIVLTEDDYFDFLIGVTYNQQQLPSDLRRALTDTSLLFLGFQMSDWSFRVLLRYIRSLPGGSRRGRDERVHVAVQIEPEAGRIQDPLGALDYLRDYFRETAEISVYWGSARDFISELKERWDSR